MNLERIKQLIKKPRRIFVGLLCRTARIWPDKLYLQLRFFFEMGSILNLKKPKTFNEKLQWLKLYNRCPEYTTMVDKYAVKQYVANKIGEKYIIETLGIWNCVEDIDLDSLPNQFVLKTTHGGGGGGVVICKDKSSFDMEAAKCKLRQSLNCDIYELFREWPYKDVPKRIIAERFMSNKGKDLEDYKIHCFNGEPKFILVCKNRYGNEAMIDDFYTPKWELMDVRRPGHPNSKEPLKKPEQLEYMFKLAEVLSKDIPFLRVDFYIIENKIYFGELTFFPASGLSKFEPKEWDKTFGNYLNLNI